MLWFSNQVVNERVAEMRNENEELRSACVAADEAHQKLLAERDLLELDLIRTKDYNSHLVEQVL